MVLNEHTPKETQFSIEVCSRLLVKSMVETLWGWYEEVLISSGDSSCSSMSKVLYNPTRIQTLTWIAFHSDKVCIESTHNLPFSSIYAKSSSFSLWIRAYLYASFLLNWRLDS